MKIGIMVLFILFNLCLEKNQLEVKVVHYSRLSDPYDNNFGLQGDTMKMTTAVFRGCNSLESFSERKICSDQRLIEYIYSNLKLKKSRSDRSTTSEMLISFAIGQSGKVEDFKVLNGHELVNKSNIVDVITKMPKWEPLQKGIRIKRKEYKIPLRLHFD